MHAAANACSGVHPPAAGIDTLDRRARRPAGVLARTPGWLARAWGMLEARKPGWLARAPGMLEARKPGWLGRALGMLEARKPGWLGRTLGTLRRLCRYCRRVLGSSSTRRAAPM